MRTALRTAFLSILVALPCLSACGARPTPVALTPASSQKPAAELGIEVSVAAGSNEAEPLADKVRSSTANAFTASGYKLVEKDGKPEVQAKMTVSATEEASLFQTQVNGKRQVTYKVQLSLALVSVADSAVLDQVTTEFSSSEGSIDENAIRNLVTQIGNNGKLVAYADKLKQNAKAVEDKKTRDEDDLWKAANAEGCTNASKQNACDGVKDYIQKYPSGRHTADGRKAIADGEVHIAKVEEENAWKAAVVDQCQKPTKSYDCADVEKYLAKYPTGTHAAEAKEAMKGSEKARESLKAKEDSAAKKASLAECSKDCQRSYMDYSPRWTALLVNRCIQLECR
jgi:hypothetical protein